jgi:hypothetical protein
MPLGTDAALDSGRPFDPLEAADALGALETLRAERTLVSLRPSRRTRHPVRTLRTTPSLGAHPALDALRTLDAATDIPAGILWKRADVPEIFRLERGRHRLHAPEPSHLLRIVILNAVDEDVEQILALRSVIDNQLGDVLPAAHVRPDWKIPLQGRREEAALADIGLHATPLAFD